ncbi:cytochrome P450 3A11-like [Parasteatoda tepidariorum]|uniref:cytochrome P450 3A11-like n=1 Tax=Parasteatoda tepidariorum TaxID=114398 RepID=UPI0039BC628E
MDLMDILFNTYVITAALGFLVYFIYRFATRNHTFWEERNVPYVKPYPFIGSLKDNFQNNVEDLDTERYKTLGKIYGFYEATKPCLMVAEPELLRDILVKDFPTFTNHRYMDMGDDVLNKMMTALQNEDWKRVRAIVSPTFSTGKLKRVLNIFQDCAKTLIQSYTKSADSKSPVDVLKFYGAYTMDIIASSAFSTKIDSHNDPDNIFIQKARSIFNQDMGFSVLLFFLFPNIMKRIGFSLFPKDTMQFFKMTTLQIIKERKKTGQKRNDFLQLLMDSAGEIEKEEDTENSSEDIIRNYGDESNNNLVFKNVSTKSLGMNELIAQCTLFFIAGYHTTALTLGFTTYHLALEQRVQDKLFQEIEEVLNQTNGELTYESIQKMKYLDNVISETLRLHPPLTRYIFEMLPFFRMFFNKMHCNKILLKMLTKQICFLKQFKINSLSTFKK